MPCTKCGKRMKTTKGCNIIYCNCKCCNHCHVTGICPDGKYWFENIKNGKHRSKFLPGQSHGGHIWIPCCNNCS